MQASTNYLRDQIVPLVVLPGLALLFRFFSFFPTVIEQEESINILIAREMLHGKYYYVDVIDTQPLGIFLIYWLFQLVIGKSILIFRLLAALWVGLTALGLFQIALRRMKLSKLAWVVGLVYILMISFYSSYGLSPNQELFANGFMVWGLYWLLGAAKSWRYLLAGGMLGLGFTIHYGVGISFVFFVLWISKVHWKKDASLGGNLLPVLILGLVMLIPTLIIFQYYRLIGYETTFLQYSFAGISGTFLSDAFFWSMATSFFFFALHFLPIIILVIRGLSQTTYLQREWEWFLVVWLLIEGLSAIWFGPQSYAFIPMLLPLSLLTGIALREQKTLLNTWGKWSIGRRSALMLALSILLLGWHKIKYLDPQDKPTLVADWLYKQLQPGDQIYTGNYEPILYFLLDREMLTPYLRPSLLWDTHQQTRLGIDLKKETRQIQALAPRFLTLVPELEHPILSDSLLLNYKPLKVMDTGVVIYSRK